MNGDEMSCRELVEVITNYLEDRLSEAERARFDAHLGDCPGCRVYLEQMRQIIRTSGSLHEDALLPEARTRLLGLFRDWKRAG